jgi:hypothetical protein
MRFSFQVPIILVLSCLPSMAQEKSELSPTQEKIEIGQGVICDTLDQVERYVALRGNGAEASAALQAVNDQAHAAACGVALVMFSDGARVVGLTVQGRLLSIIKINVRAFGSGPGWTKIPATVRYTVTAEKGQVV